MAGGGHTYRRFYFDAETDRLFFTDGETPIGDFVEELDARDWYLRAGHSLSCGWPGEHHDRDEDMCRCGFVFPHRAPIEMHKITLSKEDEDALS